jgi:hypothetical protein
MPHETRHSPDGSDQQRQLQLDLPIPDFQLSIHVVQGGSWQYSLRSSHTDRLAAWCRSKTDGLGSRLIWSLFEEPHRFRTDTLGFRLVHRREDRLLGQLALLGAVPKVELT